MQEYPKLLFKNGVEACADSPEQEAALRDDGYLAAGEPASAAAEPEPDELDEPTFGAPGDDSYEKAHKGGKKK